MRYWPPSLPVAPLLSGLDFSPAPNIISFGTEVGAGKLRPRSTARLTHMPFVLQLTRAQRDAFVSFHRDDLSAGALRFRAEDPMDSGSATFRFKPQDPPYTVRMVHANLFEVSFVLDRIG